MRLTQPRDALVREECDPDRYFPDGFFEIPDHLIQAPHEGRLIDALRNPLRDHMGDPRALLVQSALRYLLASTNTRVANETRALADLAVSGETMFRAFLRDPPRDADVLAALDATGQVPAGLQSLRAHAVDRALDRAYHVAFYLRGWAERTDWLSLGWIAVSGEDDPPHRPVNVPGPRLDDRRVFQYDLDVAVPRGAQSHAKTIRTRFIAIGRVPPPPGAGFGVRDAVRFRRTPPVDRQPVIPDDAKLVLFLHGLDSRLEECLEFAPRLIELGFTVVAMDLPNFGYGSKFGHHDIADPPPLHPRTIADGPFGALAFIEEFVVAFVDALEAQQAAPIRDRIVAVVGGSLGGNLGLRLAERGLVSVPWVHTIVSWSPASTWGWSWERFRHADGPYDIAKGVPVAKSHERMLADEQVTSRREYFQHTYLPPVFAGPRELITEAIFGSGTANNSFRDSWQPCKRNIIAGGRRERQELYSAHVRQWHWRVAHEQLVFMHLEPRERPRSRMIHSRVLLGAGEADNHFPEKLYDNTRQAATRMVTTPGATMWLKETGHSFHNERPVELANAIAAFAPPLRPASGRVEQWSVWLSLGGVALNPSSLTVATMEDGRRELYAVEQATGRIRIRRTNFRGNWLSGSANVLGDEDGVPEDLAFVGRLAVLPLDDGRLRMYAVRSDQSWMVHFTQTAINGAWRATDLGNHLRQLIGDVADVAGVVRLGSRLGGDPPEMPLHVHVVGGRRRSNRRVHIRGQNSLGYPDAYWNDQPNLGSPETRGQPLMLLDASNRVHVFTRRRDDNVVIFAREGTVPDQWTRRMIELDGLVTDGGLAGALDGVGRLRVFVRGTDGALWTAAQSQLGGSDWGGWQSLGGSLANDSRPSVVRNAWGGLHVFVRTAANDLEFRREAPSGGWSAWQTIAGGALSSDPLASAGTDGMLTVFALRNESIPWFCTQTTGPG